jgi:IS4 transposase
METTAKKVKLNKMEISAIASRIVQDVKNSNNKYNKVLEDKYPEWLKSYKKTEEYKFISSLVSGIKKHDEKYKDDYYLRFGTNLNFERFIKHHFSKTLKLKTKFPNQSEVEEDLIIAQAMNKDIESLIVELTAKYSK